jgi:2-dehydro-3-deoxyphosphogluconate aldolase/(4S)-4-hydroxy-2-oxoglutarate aldolase
MISRHKMLKIGIARGIIDESDLIPAFQACIDGGFFNLEVTMNTDNAPLLIEKSVKHFSGKNSVRIGAGTVTDMDLLKKALRSGAEFIVAPNFNPEVINFCVKRKIPVFPGALSPTEIYNAWNAGAEMVKVFPIGSIGGPEYVREIKGPFNNIKILACGGVTPENYKDFADNGTDGIAVGSSLFKRDWLIYKNYDKITEFALKFS